MSFFQKVCRFVEFLNILPDSSAGNSLIPTDFYKVLKFDKDQDVHTDQMMH